MTYSNVGHDVSIANRDFEGASLAIVGIGAYQKHHHYMALRCWGLRLTVVCDSTDYIPPELDGCMILAVPGFHDHTNDDVRGPFIAGKLRESPAPPAGVLTLGEDCGPLAAIIADDLGLPGVHPSVAAMVKSKFDTQTHLRSDRSCAASSFRVARVRRLEDLDEAVSYVGLPAVTKLEFGSGAAGVVPVSTIAEAQDVYVAISSSLMCEDDWPGIGLGFGNTIILAEHLAGSEHDVDIAIWEGDVIAAFVTDNGRTRLPSCAESSALMPSCLPSAAQKEVTDAVRRACLSMGLTHGVFNIEVILTGETPRIIDINGRMGGFYIREWVQDLWDYDLLEAAVTCALGRRPRTPQSMHDGYLAGAMLLPSVHGQWLRVDENRERLFAVGTSERCLLVQFEEAIEGHPWIDEPWGCIAARGSSPGTALDALRRVWKKVGLADVDGDLSALLPMGGGA